MAERTYGTIHPDRLRELTGLQFVEGLANGTLPQNPMAKTLGYTVAQAEKGRVVIAATPREDHFNPWGTVHGGLAATLLDSCMGLAVQSTVDRGVGSTTLDFKISFIRPITASTGVVYAEGKVLSSGRRAGTAEGRITDGAGRLLAHGTTTCLLFDIPAQSG